MKSLDSPGEKKHSGKKRRPTSAFHVLGSIRSDSRERSGNFVLYNANVSKKNHLGVNDFLNNNYRRKLIPS